MNLPEINLQDYHYQLPEDRIAKYPLPNRDDSKLLVYRGTSIDHTQFKQLGNYLLPGTTLVFNDTRVIPARLFFRKPTGATIEVFLLNPLEPTTDINVAMQAKESSTWACLIGNLKRWKKHLKLKMTLEIDGRQTTLTAHQMAVDQVRFTWDDPELSFVELVKNAGQVPLPPYFKRKAELQDRKRYQTVYSKAHGAVAAPTAGLHFTESVLKSLESQGVTKEFITLHVGAGTFMPIKTSRVTDHPMHGEQISITYENVSRLMRAQRLVAVGTTSLRTLESMYWYGVKLMGNQGEAFEIEKLVGYREYGELPDFRESLQAIKAYMETKQLKSIRGYTEIFIFSPYQVRSCHGLITNFHLPSSSLILLVVAFVGNDWKLIYREALEKGYRFLSYGDSSLLLPIQG